MCRRSAIGILHLAVAVLIFSGCASTTTPKPDQQAASTSSTKKPVSKATTGQAVAGTPSGSSLEAHRQGVAPAAGPLKEIYFEFDKYDLTAQARTMLQQHAGWLKGNPSARAEIEGHCDERGTTEYNMALGAKRAQAAKDYLGSLGVSPQRVSTISYGKELLLCRDQTEDCHQRNRRDRFVIVAPRPTS